jgi:hypothetical protein
MIKLSIMIKLQVLLRSSGLFSLNALKSQVVFSVLETTMRLFLKQIFPQSLLIYIITLCLTFYAG